MIKYISTSLLSGLLFVSIPSFSQTKSSQGQWINEGGQSIREPVSKKKSKSTGTSQSKSTNVRTASFCFTDRPDFNTLISYKITLNEGGSATMDKDGNKIQGTWRGTNSDPKKSTIINATFNGQTLKFESSYTNSMGNVSMFTDRQGRQWMECF